MKHIYAALCLASVMMVSVPLSAQDRPNDDVCMAIVYGDDAAPQCDGNEIVVVARMPEGDRYRIPETLRFSEDADNQAWSKRVEALEMTGEFGALSCSTAGGGGFTGCTQKLLAQAYGEKRDAPSVRFSELIAAARASRLSTIDQDAAEEQARVEQIEREYMERLEREREAEILEDLSDDLDNALDQAVEEQVRVEQIEREVEQLEREREEEALEDLSDDLDNALDQAVEEQVRVEQIEREVEQLEREREEEALEDLNDDLDNALDQAVEEQVRVEQIEREVEQLEREREEEALEDLSDDLDNALPNPNG